MEVINYFYNAKFNTTTGCGGKITGDKFIWGISNTFDLSKPLQEQILKIYGIKEEEITNFNITAFNKV